jgi:hypothetical protein
MSKVEVELPANLCRLSGASTHVWLEVPEPVTQRSVLDALEARYPMLEGCVRDHTTKIRRPFIRFFACEEDLSHMEPDEALPLQVARGAEVFLILGAIAGG